MAGGSPSGAVEIMVGYDFLDLGRVHAALMDAVEECRACLEAGESAGGYVVEVEERYEAFRSVMARLYSRLGRWSDLTDVFVEEVIGHGV